MRHAELPSRYFVMLTVSLLLAMILTIIPLPAWAVWARPNWVLLVLIFWVAVSPLRVSVGTAFIVGLILDLLTGTLFAQHAFSFCVLAYVAIKLQQVLRVSPLWQQTLLIFLLAMFNLALQLWIMNIAGVPVTTVWYWISAPVSAIVWPWVTLLLHNYSVRLA